MKNVKVWLILGFAIIIFWLLLTHKITEVPPGINGDEAAIGYNAALVSKTGHDQNRRFLPLFVSTFDLTDWKQPITFYSTVLAFKLFGPSYALLREVSVIFVLISTFLIFLLGRELMGFKTAFVSLFIFITIPSVLIQSHLALENIAPVPFTILWLLMLAKYRNTLKRKFLLLAGLSLGINLFTYSAVRIIFPIFFLLSIWFIYYLNRETASRFRILSVLIFSIAALVFPLFMFSVKNQYPGAILAYNRPHNVSSYQDFFLPYISSFDPSFLFITGDTTPYHSTGKQGVFLLTTLPLFILGIIRIVRKKDLMLNFILLAFFLSPLLYGLVGTIHRGSRLLVLLPFYALIATNGILILTPMRNNVSKFILVTIATLLILLNYVDFLRDYWYEYPQRVKSEFAKPIHLVFEKFSKESKEKNLKPLIQSDLFGQNPIAFNFFEQAYFQNQIERWDSKQQISKNSVLLTDNPLVKLNNPTLKSIKIDNSNFYLLENR